MLIGAAAGAAATLPMTIAMERLHEWLPGEPPRPLPPREIIEGVADQAGVQHELREGEKEALTLAGHVGYGAACGAIFGIVAPRNPVAAVTSGVGVRIGRVGGELSRVAAGHRREAPSEARSACADRPDDRSTHRVRSGHRCIRGGRAASALILLTALVTNEPRSRGDTERHRALESQSQWPVLRTPTSRTHKRFL